MAYASWSVVYGETPSASKWNILGTNDASFNDGTGIAASAITPEKLLTGTGTSWPWQSWTPTIANMSGGTLNYAKYVQVGKIVFFRFKYTLAGAGMGTTPTFTLPAAMNSDINDPNVHHINATVSLRDFGTGTNFGILNTVNSTTVELRTYLISGSYINRTGLSSTVPFTWASGDAVVVEGYYEAA